MCGRNPSYGWTSLQAGKDLLKQGLQSRLGNGKETNVWLDHWLPVLPPRLAQGNVQHLNMKVEELWKQGEKSWDENLLRSVLTHEDAELAKNIRLSRFAIHDKRIWSYTSTAEYTVKSGYWVATHLVPDNEKIEPPAGSLEVKKKIWRVKMEPKIQHFIWKAVAGAIPSSERLCSKTLDIDPVCQRCSKEHETINHLLFHCHHVKAIWRGARFAEFDNPNSTLEDNIRMMLQINERSTLRVEDRFLPFWIVWKIWKSRNEFIFTQKSTQAAEDVLKSMEAVAGWILAKPISPIQHNIQTQGISATWEPPPLGWLKCNFDSSIDNDYMGVGWIIRDEYGHYIESGWARLENVGSILEAEGNGFLYVVQRVWQKGFRQVWFEGDNLQLVNIINKQKDSLVLVNLLVDIYHWISKLPLCSLDHVGERRIWWPTN
ncbi:unnamed protein product [Microthlaspi erraticum]|uniref:Reverse transcriptase zinc-binding domain-containing protein n=1 Tax=Microthlaspi erraticum TaxID=1685480 RepID=A0A6D2HPZ9_9BRAS|nr:unnamed protein product [Microthlaspi erraticum]